MMSSDFKSLDQAALFDGFLGFLKNSKKTGEVISLQANADKPLLYHNG
ncbi:hypothetical protein [Sulfobacillus thermosulfidooxidans]|nr:hypothetical protein [Sulfobacillus thermosulfidooxidans]